MMLRMQGDSLGTCTSPDSATARFVREAVATFLYALVIVFASPTVAEALPQVRKGIVSRVVDGDTVWVNSEGILLKVRIAGIDAPEICQPHGPIARDALQRRALGQMVTITYQRVDDYGRLLSRVNLDGEDLGRWLVLQGHAWSYGYRNHPGPYAQEQQAASASRLGVFALETPDIPGHFRKRHGSCFP